jgi:hypothetical protein
VTGRVVVFSPHVAGDSALENSRWVAERNAERLGETAVVLSDIAAVRTGLEAALEDALVEGVVLCGHGDGGKHVFLLRNQHHERGEGWHRRYAETSERGAVYGSDHEAALDHDNVSATAGRWVHVIACEVGLSELPDLAVAGGATAFAAYEESLVPEFTVPSLPAAAVTILAHLAAMTTASLAKRNFERDALAAEVRRASEDLDAWFDSDEGTAWMEGPGAFERVGLTKFAKQLSSALRVVRAAPPRKMERTP